MFHNVWHCSRLNVWCYFWGRVFGCHWSSWTVERSNTEERSALLAWLKWLVILVIVRLTVIVTTSFSPNYIIHGIFISTSQTLNHCRQLLAIEFRVLETRTTNPPTWMPKEKPLSVQVIQGFTKWKRRAVLKSKIYVSGRNATFAFRVMDVFWKPPREDGWS